MNARLDELIRLYGLDETAAELLRVALEADAELLIAAPREHPSAMPEHPLEPAFFSALFQQAR